MRGLGSLLLRAKGFSSSTKSRPDVGMLPLTMAGIGFCPAQLGSPLCQRAG
jgi:hypothetical protein